MLSSIALAVLEVLAYRKAKKPLAPRHLFEVMLHETQVRWLGPNDLPDDWHSYPHSEQTQQLGDSWVQAGKTVGLAVSSVLAPPEVNVMLNCRHPDFASLDISGPKLFPVNPRLMPDASQHPQNHPTATGSGSALTASRQTLPASSQKRHSLKLGVASGRVGERNTCM